MKRVSALILALIFLFLASCGTDAAPETTTEQANSASTDLKIDYETVKIRVVTLAARRQAGNGGRNCGQDGDRPPLYDLI